MATNVLIKELENLNISKDDDDVTVTSHEVEKVTDGNENVEDDMYRGSSRKFERDQRTVSQSSKFFGR